ncbi:MAG: hypothetical protein MUF72_04520 [Elainella sp. Prado103]|jgi:nickel transport protein|nr:hypothetical protein [Elainella sp. Prado103]
MKSVIRWALNLSVAGGVLLSTLASGVQVLALPQEQVMERLRSVPVFTLTNNEGSPLLAVPTEGEDRDPIASVFISRTDAEAFLNGLRSRDPQTAEGIQVVPVPLAKIYELEMQQQQQNAEEQLRFAFIPEQRQVEAARTVLQQSGQNSEFQGVPLFIARSGGEEGGYLTINQGEQQVIPMFFDRAELQGLLDRLQQVQPDLASTVQVQVVNLEGVIQTLQNSDNQELTRIVLVPSQASRDYIRSLQNTQGGQPAPAGNTP